ncbi:ATP-binding protein [Acidobacteriota bacterium]
MTLLKKLQQTSAKTKILLFSLLLIFLPSSFLGYRGYKSIADRELRLKDNYSGLARLLRDQLEGNLKNLEENFIKDILTYNWNQDVSEIQSQLEKIRIQYPIVGDIFFIDLQGSIIHSDLHLINPSSVHSENSAVQALNSTFVSTGERYMFFENNYPQALSSYKRALDETSSIHVKTYIRMLIARCYFKMKNYSMAAENFQRLADANGDVRSTDGTPLKIIGLSQLAESFSQLGQKEDYYRTLLLLYRELISAPFGFESYDFYLQKVKEELSKLSQEPDWDNEYQMQLDELNEEETNQQQTIHLLESARRTVMEKFDTNSAFSREVIPDGDGNSHQMTGVPLPSLNSLTSNNHLVYEIDEDFVLTSVLPEIGSKENIGGSIRIGITSEDESFSYPKEAPSVLLGLASEELTQFFPWWRLVIFDKKGKTVEQIVRREKQLYGGALLGIFVLILGGAGLTLRAAVHEAEAARIKSEFVSNVSHELKTPLALIRLFGETLEMEDIDDKKKRKKFSHIITRETKRLSHLVENVLDFSRIDAGRKEYNFAEADIVQVVSHTLEAYRYYLKDLDFEFVTSIPNEPILMSIDKDAVSQALLNLVSNAEKFSGERKYIGVKMVLKDSEVWITVEDKGPGIPDSSIRQIFDKFNRGVGELAREVQGSGLGLTITKHIVESHGGQIEVESHMGKGSRFILKLPMNKDKI